MKKFFAIIITLFATSAFAQDRQRPELTPEQKLKGALTLANAGTALIVGPVALPAAILSGKTEALCHVLEGHKKPSSYNPNSDGKDQCPDGIWLRIIPYVTLKDTKG